MLPSERRPAKGAETLVRLATSTPQEDWKFDEHCKDKEISKGTRQANDPDLANGLWELSAKLTNLK